MSDQLAAFSGWTARWWSYSVSHGRLTLELRPPDPHQDVRPKYLSLFFCEQISGPTEWHIHHLVEARIGENNRLLEDQQQNVRFEYAVCRITDEPLDELIHL
jgi:hypothetical protein